jgi:hypothetical protein
MKHTWVLGEPTEVDGFSSEVGILYEPYDKSIDRTNFTEADCEKQREETYQLFLEKDSELNEWVTMLFLEGCGETPGGRKYHSTKKDAIAYLKQLMLEWNRG